MRLLEDLTAEVAAFLKDKPALFQHCLAVANEARDLAAQNDENPEKAYAAGLLHDVGGIFPTVERIQAAEQFGLDLLPEEREFPLIIHQKLSRALAQRELGIDDGTILDAIECHTTLRAGFTKLDLIVFLADKICWDGGDNAPFKDGLQANLAVSLEEAARFYIDFILQEGLKVEHPWLVAAREELESEKNPEK